MSREKGGEVGRDGFGRVVGRFLGGIGDFLGLGVGE